MNRLSFELLTTQENGHLVRRLFCATNETLSRACMVGISSDNSNALSSKSVDVIGNAAAALGATLTSCSISNIKDHFIEDHTIGDSLTELAIRDSYFVELAELVVLEVEASDFVVGQYLHQQGPASACIAGFPSIGTREQSVSLAHEFCMQAMYTGRILNWDVRTFATCGSRQMKAVFSEQYYKDASVRFEEFVQSKTRGRRPNLEGATFACLL